ncbi:YbgC/FadM family acyl-CoA thioesterase [Sphingomonas sp. LY29]|uniref:YbgC/FadM family acyl-CoA thioesterase n=1 Tax=unclassified Sphingomonas TaxID=196159 RepID=UPI002ADEDC3D|nr:MULTISPECIES: YbgC/FadM family acyl-CoA thioesterase [unclassified Sphingomonas]MEA1072747.1 YbgC/FadM family acyl-CoA thioesterase [Sphingomonas sp. LY160]WRP26946.1 YbgC/FadM family acyl-CoA thioesterase [Sphingomonas sp. LY29]
MEPSPFDKPYRGGFVGSEHRFALTVFYEDTDTAGIVYHANYLRFFERARSDMLRVAGIDQRAAIEDGIGTYAVSEMAIKWRRPAKLDDDLLILSRVTQVRAASCAIHQRVMRGNELLAEAEVVAALLSPEGRPRRQPAEWVDIFKRLETKGE